ncbi:MAG: YdeI/OmpD-associated family protein [bacterium]
MVTNGIAGGTVHSVPADLRKALISKVVVLDVWQDITPLARNEWICWIESAKKIETRESRMRIMTENLAAGKRRPCCWAGCAHRGNR